MFTFVTQFYTVRPDSELRADKHYSHDDFCVLVRSLTLCSTKHSIHVGLVDFKRLFNSKIFKSFLIDCYNIEVLDATHLIFPVISNMPFICFFF